jgi:hypothetical protein
MPKSGTFRGRVVAAAALALLLAWAVFASPAPAQEPAQQAAQAPRAELAEELRQARLSLEQLKERLRAMVHPVIRQAAPGERYADLVDDYGQLRFDMERLRRRVHELEAALAGGGE